MSMALIAALIISGCTHEDTPEAALDDIKAAIVDYDSKKFFARVDIDSLLNHAYDDATVELANHAAEFNALYPDDPFFQNAADFIVMYNQLKRAEHMDFINAIVVEFFNKELQPPAVFDDDTVAGTAAELRHFYKTAASTIKSVEIDQTRAVVSLDVTGKSLYTKTDYVLPLTLEFEKVDERWRLIKVERVDEIIMPLVDVAEILWPEKFN